MDLITQAQAALLPETMTAKDIVAALAEHYRPDDRWVFFPELRIGTGYGKDAEQRIDGWAINLFPSMHLLRVAYEIKVSRSDFLHEIKHPNKRRRALLLSNEYYFITPRGMLRDEEIPVECGLREVHEGGYIHTRIAAPHRDTPPPSWRFLASIARLARKAARP